MEFRQIACKSIKQAKGHLTSLDGVSVLNSVGRGPSTTRAAFYRSPPPSPFSVTPLPFLLIFFATACPIDCYRTRHRREWSRTNLSFLNHNLIIAKVPTQCINFNHFSTNGAILI